MARSTLVVYIHTVVRIPGRCDGVLLICACRMWILMRVELRRGVPNILTYFTYLVPEGPYPSRRLGADIVALLSPRGTVRTLLGYYVCIYRNGTYTRYGR